jgi:ATP-dependent Lon protease
VQTKQDILENFNIEDRVGKILGVLETSISSQEFSTEMRDKLNEKLSSELKRQTPNRPAVRRDPLESL